MAIFFEPTVYIPLQEHTGKLYTFTSIHLLTCFNVLYFVIKIILKNTGRGAGKNFGPTGRLMHWPLASQPITTKIM